MSTHPMTEASARRGHGRASLGSDRRHGCRGQPSHSGSRSLYAPKSPSDAPPGRRGHFHQRVRGGHRSRRSTHSPLFVARTEQESHCDVLLPRRSHVFGLSTARAKVAPVLTQFAGTSQLQALRKGGDSNSRDGGCPPAGFQDRCIQPLCHPSRLTTKPIDRGARGDLVPETVCLVREPELVGSNRAMSRSR